MKIMAINGSPRRAENTARLLHKALEGAASLGAETEYIDLYPLKYKGCLSCFYCKRKDKEHGVCIVKDDLAPVLERAKQADALLFGSPIYFMNLIQRDDAPLVVVLLNPDAVRHRQWREP